MTSTSAICEWLAAHGSSCLEAFGFVTGTLNVWLVTRQNIWSWPLGVVNALVYMFVFARTGLYSDTGLQAVYLLLSVYGWWHWWFGGVGHDSLRVSRTAGRSVVLLAAAALCMWAILWSITSRIPGVALPHIDAALVSLSLVAQWMMTRKLLESWAIWIVVDLAYVGLFVNRQLPLTAVLYAIFLVLAVSGHFRWSRSIGERQQ